MSTELMVQGTAFVVVGYLILVGIIALIASAHWDEKRRADAAKVLKRLLRRGRR